LTRILDNPSSPRVPLWAAMLFFAAMALVLTWPLILHLGNLVVGDQQGDMWKHLWGFWWMREEIFDHHRLPLWTRLLNYPYGGNLFFIDPLNVILSFPLQFTVGLIPAYNLIVIFNIFLGGLGAWILARYITRSDLGALVAGVIYGSCPYVLCYIASGVTEAINIGWIPLYLYALLRTLETARLLWALAAGYLLFLCAFGCWYYGIFMVFFTLIILVEGIWSRLEITQRLREAVRMAGKGRPGGRLAPVGSGLGKMMLALIGTRTLKMLIVTAGVACALTFPIYAVFSRTINNPTSLVYREREKRQVTYYLSENFHNVSHLVDYVKPGKASVIRSYTVDRLWRSSYAGYVTLFLALAAVVTFYRQWYFRFWAAAGLIFAMFSLGPFLYVAGNIHLPMTHPSPIYMALYYYLPFFQKVAIPYRFDLLFMLCAGMLAAGGLSCWLVKFRPRQQVLIVVVTCLAVLLEIILVSPAPYHLPMSSLEVPAAYRQMARDQQEYGIIDLPFQRIKGELLPGEYFYYQMFHHKNIPNKVEGTIAVYVFQNPFMVHLFNMEHGYTRVEPDEPSMRKALDRLKDARFKYLVVHDNLMFPSARERIHQLLIHFLGPPRTYPDGIKLYRVY